MIRDIAESVSMIELVQRHVPLKRRGSSWVGLCPFHNEKSPSFHVNDVRKTFHCFGCGEGGDALKWLQEVEGLSFMEAVQNLADQAGILLPKEELSPSEQAAVARRQRLLHANEVACRYFAETLAGPQGQEGRAELARRQIPAELIEKYRLGLALDQWDGLSHALAAAHVDPAIADEAGLLVRKKEGNGYYDRFRHRLIFPISDVSGKVVAFGGRTLGDDRAKYINSPETPVYSKSRTLFGLHEARRFIHKDDRVLVVEGYFDVLGLAKAGLGCAVAPCGTALTSDQLRALRRHTQRVVLFFDGDSAGQAASFKALQMCLEADLWPVAPLLPGGADPDDYVREHGTEAMLGVISEARPLVDAWLDHNLAAAGTDPWARGKLLEELLPVLVAVPKQARQPYLDRVSMVLGIDLRELGKRLKTAERAQERKAAARSAASGRSEGFGSGRSDGPGSSRGGPQGGGRGGPQGGGHPGSRSGGQPRSGAGRGAPSAGPRAPGGRGPSAGPRAGGHQQGAPARQGPGEFSDGVPFWDDDAPLDESWEGFPDDDVLAGPPVAAMAPAPSMGPPDPAELKLLKCLVQDLSNVAPAMEEMGALSWLHHPDVEAVAGQLLRAWRDKQGPFGMELLDGVRDPQVRRQVTADITSSAQHYPEEILEEATQECLIRLHVGYLDRRIRKLVLELDGLNTRGGGFAQARPLLEERRELERQRAEWRQFLRGPA